MAAARSTAQVDAQPQRRAAPRALPARRARGRWKTNASKPSIETSYDWREEVIFRCGDSLRMYTTTQPTATRIYTLMHDPQYRAAVSFQNVAYNQPPHPSFHIGSGMAPPPRPDIHVR